MNNKKYIGAFFAILMTLCLFAAGQIVSAQSPVVQTVNGVEFTADQYIESAQFYRFNLIQQYNYYLTIYRMYGLEVGSDLNDQFEEILGPEGADKVREVVLSNAARQVIIAAEAEKAGLSVSDEEIDERIKSLFGFDETESSEKTTEEETEESLDALGAESVNTEPEINKELDFRKKLDEYFETYVGDAFSFDFFKGDVRAMLLEEKLQAYVIGESDEVYEQEMVKARHILVETEEEAIALRKRLDDGEDWATIAAENSLDTGNKDNSGDLGWFARGMMVKPFEEAAFALEPGQISDPIKSDFGYHIIALDEKEMREMEGADLKEAQEITFAKWFEEIEKNYTIETSDDAVKDIVVDKPVFEPYVPIPTEVSPLDELTETVPAP